MNAKVDMEKESTEEKLQERKGMEWNRYARQEGKNKGRQVHL